MPFRRSNLRFVEGIASGKNTPALAGGARENTLAMTINSHFHLPEHSNEAIIRFAQSGRSAVRLARLHGVQEVGGSNPLAPTAIRKTVLTLGGFIFMKSKEESAYAPVNTQSIYSKSSNLIKPLTL
jgi:hypothetical protein